MHSNRSIPRGPVIPVLAYPDVDQAASWLCHAFGFTVRLRILSHRIQLNFGEGALVVRELREGEASQRRGIGTSVLIRVDDADAHCQRARERGARITQEPTTYPFGERQYTAEDFAGYSWTFSQSVADVHPSEWGGVAEEL
ncbi:glyoxalase [Acidobacteria bacterium AB60]|nr:glyoxalase [Acidobacteria bacterium AB60]